MDRISPFPQHAQSLPTSGLHFGILIAYLEPTGPDSNLNPINDGDYPGTEGGAVPVGRRGSVRGRPVRDGLQRLSDHQLHPQWRRMEGPAGAPGVHE